MSDLQAPQGSSNVRDGDVFLHLKEIIVTFTDKRRPMSDVIVKFKDKASAFKIASKAFKRTEDIHWQADIYAKRTLEAVLTIHRDMRFVPSIATPISKIPLTFSQRDFGENRTVKLTGREGCDLTLVFSASMTSVEVARALGGQASAALASRVSMLDKLTKVLDFLDIIKLGSEAAQLNPIAQAVVPIVTSALAKFREIPSCHQQFIDIMNDLVLMIPVMELALRRLLDVECLDLVKNFITFVEETSKDIITYASVSGVEMMFRNWYASKKDDAVRLKDRSEQMKRNLELAVTLDVQHRTSDLQVRTSEVQDTVSNIQRDQLRIEDENILKRIKPPKLSSFDPRRCCLSGTRTSVLDDVRSFALSEDPSQRFYWLYGIAGSGKSSVATSVAVSLDVIKRLSGSFFCKRDIPELRNPINLVHALAYSIAEFHAAYRTALVKVLNEDSRIEDKALVVQVDALLKDPLYRISEDRSHVPIVFVIDALDECDDNKSVSSVLTQIVDRISWLRLIVTSRPDIVQKIPRLEGRLRSRDLFVEDAHQDIEKFTRSQFAPEGSLADLQPYVDDAQLRELSKKSSGLFIWIATVLSHISGLLFGKHAALLDILYSDNATGPEAQLDILYLQVVRSVTGSSAANRDAVKTILAIIHSTSRNRALPSVALYTFVSKASVRVSLEELDNFLRQMGSVLMTDQTGAIRVCHPSFLDFIGTQSRSKDFWTSTEHVDAMMMKECLEVMNTQLRFNICRLDTPLLRNDEVADLQERIAQRLPLVLQYSCIYWFDHLFRSNETCKQNMLIFVNEFLRHPESMYWLEVLSLISELKASIAIFDSLPTFSSENAELTDIAVDYYRFVNMFHTPISVSALHVYISALLWTPSSSAISRLHSAAFHGEPLILKGRRRDWPMSLQAIKCNRVVYCVEFSPDGSRIISGSYDNTIRIWNARSGAAIGEPLKGHTKRVSSVAYSPDGSRIVSGSWDHTLRIWDAQRGAPIGEPVKGHTKCVTAVAYSPDGSRIVSGSDDYTLHIWNARSSAPIGEPLKGHTRTVNSVAYSTDGSRIVSGSYDSTLRIWDARSGVPNGEPLQGHTDYVSSVNYSPDGSRIASGSWGHTLRIWNARNGAPIGEPLKGHTWNVTSVAYSPDGSRIVSASNDKTLRIWDARSGAPIGEPLKGHTWKVTSATYSPDGSRIISSSEDHTVRIWSTETDERIPASIPDDGWIRNASGRLLLWVPLESRWGVCDMSMFSLPRDDLDHPIKIDWERLESLWERLIDEHCA